MTWRSVSQALLRQRPRLQAVLVRPQAPPVLRQWMPVALLPLPAA